MIKFILCWFQVVFATTILLDSECDIVAWKNSNDLILIIFVIEMVEHVRYQIKPFLDLKNHLLVWKSININDLFQELIINLETYFYVLTLHSQIIIVSMQIIIQRYNYVFCPILWFTNIIA